jgi:hypothetical protein
MKPTMKKITHFLLFCLLATLPAFAENASVSDTSIIYRDKVIELEDSVGQVKVKVYDATGNNAQKPYKQVFEGIYSDEKSFEKWTVIEELNVQLPFIGKKKHSHSMEAHWAGIGYGLTNVTDELLNLSTIGAFDLDDIKSREFFLNFTDIILPLFRNNLGITSGLGFDWRNYYFTNNSHLVQTAGVVSTAPAPEGINYKYSRLRTVYLTIPLMLEWQPTFGDNHKSYLAAGVVGGIRTLAASKVKYEDANGHNVKIVEGKGLNVAPLTLDYVATAGIGNFGLYAKYSPFGIFQNGKGPEVRSISLGVMLGF